MRKLLGTKNGKRVFGVYRHRAGGLPSLNISKRKFRGSSLGPANYMCEPNKTDIEYWRSIAIGEELID